MHPIMFYLPPLWLQHALGTHIPALPIYSYGMMLGFSLLIAWQLIQWLGKTREGLDTELMSNCFLWTAVASIAGARALYVLTNLNEFASPMDWLSIRSGGMVAYGGFLGGFFGSVIYLRIKKIALLPWADVVSPTLATGLLFTRIGCYLFGCDFGKRLEPTAPSWLQKLGTFPHWDFDALKGFTFSDPPVGSPAWAHHVESYQLPFAATASYPVHPTQLYESLAGLVLFAITMLVWYRRKFRGQVLFVLVMGYGVWRFFIEMMRDDPERGALFGLSTSQLISAALIPIAGYAYWHFYREAKANGFPLVRNLSMPPLEVAKPVHASPIEKSPVKKAKKKKR